MTDWGLHTVAAAADIDAVFATATIRYTPRGGVQGPEINVIPVERGGDEAFGEGNSIRQRGYEIAMAKLPAQPGNGDTIADGDAQMKVIEVETNSEASAWVVIVEKRS